MENEKLVKLRQALEAATPAKPKTPRRRAVPAQSIQGDNNIQAGGGKVARQSIKGNGNVQVAGSGNTVNNLTVQTTKGATIKIGPAPDSIGGDGLLKERVKEAFGRLGQEREKRFGKSAYEVMYGKFKRDFSIPKALPWTVIWDWPASRAAEIIDYLEAKYGETIGGKIEGAAKKPGYRHTRGHLFKRENELLAQLDLKPDSPEVRAEMLRYFGTDSHKGLDNRQHANWVAHIERWVDRLYESKD